MSVTLAQPPFLTDAEIAGVCDGLVLPGAQCRHLERLGLLVKRKPNGRPLVARSEFERWKNPPPPQAAEEDWPRPAERTYLGSPLHRYHLDQRRIKVEIEAERKRDADARLAAQPKVTLAERRRQNREQEEAERIRRAAIVRFHASKRRTARLRRTPLWADLDAMRAIYGEAQALTAATGIPHHVDHQIPLQGKLVSGLHVHNNLQILTGSENSKKRNRFEIEP